MRAELKLIGGRLLDPSAGLNQIADLTVADGRICPLGTMPEKVRDTIDVSGCLVVPGLIDVHCHVYSRGSQLGTPADAALFPMGVTTAVDMGSAGYQNFTEYLEEAASMRSELYHFVNVTPLGPISLKESEYADPELFDEGALRDCVARPHTIGLKVRMGKETIRELGIRPLAATVELAEKLGCRVAVHVSGSTVPVREMADLLRTNDMFCHVYQDRGDTILDEHGAVYPQILKARDRGVLFDVAHGLKNASNQVARDALKQGFLPDFIGTDISSLASFRPPVIGQPCLMSRYMAMGLSLPQVITMTTAAPAKWLEASGRLGTLQAGADGDITVLKQISRRISFSDYHGDLVQGEELLVPMLTVKNGKIVYRSVEL